MEDMDFGQTSIDEEIGISIDGARAISIDKSTIGLPKDDTERFGISPEYLIMVRQNPFRGTVSERPQDHIEYLEELINDEYNH
ncbi:hypothetical protein DY000_02060019 [Brassica cretica]|nr:hypothetical protein DY000_02060019 [Brassica cretica]